MRSLQRAQVRVGALASTQAFAAERLRASMATLQPGWIGINAELNKQTSVFVNQAVTYAPAYLHGLFAPVGAVGPGTSIGPAVMSKSSRQAPVPVLSAQPYSGPLTRIDCDFHKIAVSESGVQVRRA